MIKKFVFWFYAIVGPAIAVFFTFGENFINWKLDATYAWFVLVPFITISISLILMINHRLESLKSKSLRILTPGILYLLGITCAGLFIDFSQTNFLAFLLVVLVYSIVIVGITFLEFYLYRSLVLGHKGSSKTDIENTGKENRKSFSLKSFAIKTFRILVTTFLILIIPIYWFVTVTSYNGKIGFQYDKFAFTQSPTSARLGQLASDLLYSNHLEDRLIYFDLVLKDPDALKKVYSNVKLFRVEIPALVYPNSEDELYDLVLLQYLNTYLHQGNISEYQKQFILKFNDLKSSSYMVNYLSYEILVKEKSDKDLPIIIDTMTNLYKTVQGSDKISVYKRVLILTVQAYCYMAMGNTEKQNEINKQIKKLFEDYNNSQKTNYVYGNLFLG